MWDRLTLQAAPAETAVTLVEAKAHLRVTHSDEDALITSLISAATAEIDGPNGIGIALMSQTWDLTLDCFADAIEIPMYPVASITSVKHTDVDGNTGQIVDVADYELHKYATSAVLALAHGASWPGTLSGLNRVCIRFVAGYASSNAVPADLKQALLMTIGHWYKNRESVVVGQPGNALPHAVKSIFGRYRVGTVL